jgi:hypothetical protein
MSMTLRKTEPFWWPVTVRREMLRKLDTHLEQDTLTALLLISKTLSSPAIIFHLKAAKRSWKSLVFGVWLIWVWVLSWLRKCTNWQGTWWFWGHLFHLQNWTTTTHPVGAGDGKNIMVWLANTPKYWWAGDLPCPSVSSLCPQSWEKETCVHSISDFKVDFKYSGRDLSLKVRFLSSANI